MNVYIPFTEDVLDTPTIFGVYSTREEAEDRLREVLQTGWYEHPDSEGILCYTVGDKLAERI